MLSLRRLPRRPATAPLDPGRADWAVEHIDPAQEEEEAKQDLKDQLFAEIKERVPFVRTSFAGAKFSIRHRREISIAKDCWRFSFRPSFSKVELYCSAEF